MAIFQLILPQLAYIVKLFGIQLSQTMQCNKNEGSVVQYVVYNIEAYTAIHV